MPRFAANLTLLFNEVPFLERFSAAAKAGFGAVEYLFPYPYEKDQLAEQLREHHLEQVLFNLPAGNWANGERGIACLPDRQGEFQDGVEAAIAYAKVLGCRQINCLAGIAGGVSADKAHRTLVDNLSFAAAKLGQAGLRLLIEPINTRDIPGFFLTYSRQALEVMKDVASDNLWLQYDVYHMQVMEGDLATTIAKNIARISHFQIADNPGRHEPGTGEINYPFLMSFIDGLGYEGWVGCEYKPAASTTEGLKWLNGFRNNLPETSR